MVTAIELNQIKEKMLSTAKAIFKRDKMLAAVAMIFNQDGEPVFIPLPFRDDREKEALLGIVKEKSKELNASAVCIVTEAWMAAMKEEDYKNYLERRKKEGIKISDLTERKECVVVTFETQFGQEIITYTIDRQINELVDEKRTKEFKSVFINMVPPLN